MEKHQKQLHEIVCNVMRETNTNNGSTVYESVLSMVYTLIEEGRLNEIHELFQKEFPEYYFDNE
jgi:hypothetical protein